MANCLKHVSLSLCGMKTGISKRNSESSSHICLRYLVRVGTCLMAMTKKTIWRLNKPITDVGSSLTFHFLKHQTLFACLPTSRTS